MDIHGILGLVVTILVIVQQIIKATKGQSQTQDQPQAVSTDLPDLANQPSPFADRSGKLSTPVSQAGSARRDISTSNPKGIQAKFDAQQVASKLAQPEKRASFQESQDKAAQQDAPYVSIQASSESSIAQNVRVSAAHSLEKTLNAMPTINAAIVSAVIFSNALDRPYGGKPNPLMLRNRKRR
jgi:hypothetical protein